jgi:hypothetical protein
MGKKTWLMPMTCSMMMLKGVLKQRLRLTAWLMRTSRWKDGSMRKPRQTVGLTPKLLLTVGLMQKPRLTDESMRYSGCNYRSHCCDSQYLSCAWNYCNY